MPSAIDPSWDDEALRSTIADSASEGDDAHLPDAIRFLRNVSKLVRRRATRDVQAPEPIAVFLLCPGGPDPSLNVTVTRAPMLSSGSTAVEGSIWIVGPMASWGQGVSTVSATDDEIFRIVTDDLGLGDAPAIVYDPRTVPFEVRHYPAGLANIDNCAVRPALFRKISIDEVLDAVSIVHANQLVTPNAQNTFLKLWQNAKLFRPKKDAELRVQAYLQTALGSTFPTCRVLPEQMRPGGRSDLELEEKDPNNPGGFVRHALLELKVLRSFGSTGISYSETKTKEWVSDGVRQAHVYRDERGTIASALCCFDMRVDPDLTGCFSHVKAIAKKKAVTLRAWPIYPSAKAYQKAISP